VADGLSSLIARLGAAAALGDDPAMSGRITQEPQDAIRAADRDARCERSVPRND